MEEKEYDFIIESEDGTARIDAFLPAKIGVSRAMAQKLIDEGLVQVNGAGVKHSYKVKPDDRVCVKVPPPKKIAMLPENIPLNIIYQDKDIIVVDKSPGLVVHPAVSVRSGTLVNALLYHIKDLSSIGGEHKPGIVHRLDKETSGLMVVAKNDNAHINLQQQIEGRTVKKIYQALVFGEIKPNSGVIDEPIGRHPVHRMKMAVILNSKLKSRHAVTHYKVIKQYKDYSFLELDLKTGRTHQIRVHLSYLKHPIVGDKTYTRKKNNLGAGRQLLHAHILGFKHPVTGEYMEFKSDVPEDFREILGRLE
ncbi:RluA family pseudouridine synthase [Candidatus Margulisiibacteriota bacterium]